MRKKRFFHTVPCLLSILLCLPICAATSVAGAALPLDTASFSVLPEATVPVTAAPQTSAASYALLDPVSGKLLAERDADTRRPMASTTKIMTALVVLERCDL